MDGSTAEDAAPEERPSEEGSEATWTEPRPDVAAEVPEADAIEQAQRVTEEEPLASERLAEVPADVPEADAIEQSIEVPDDDEERR